jgi:ABC-type Fe3+/spermidine/putrescine transport system ATPase subunit
MQHVQQCDLPRVVCGMLAPYSWSITDDPHRDRDPLVSAVAVAQIVVVAALLLLLDRFVRLGPDDTMTAAALALDSLSKQFGTHTAVDAVTLDMQRGELIVLLGPSGCGKTTTLRMIAGFVPPSAGDIQLDGASIVGVPPHRREMGIVFQSYALFPHLTVARNVAFGLEMRRMAADAAQARVAEMLRPVKLEAFAQRLPRQLFGCQQQRVALARAPAIHPRVLLLDEPLSNLDASLRQEMAREIRILQQRGGITTIMVTHDQTEAMALADRLVVMHDGHLQQIGTPEDVHSRPANPFVALFIGGSNIVTGRLDGDSEAGSVVDLGGQITDFMVIVDNGGLLDCTLQLARPQANLHTPHWETVRIRYWRNITGQLSIK